ncbi:MAG: Veg family protein [Clostridia bacterium]
MRVAKTSKEEIVDMIMKLKGEKIKMHINKGRKKIIKYTGFIENIYPSIFTVRLEGEKNISNMSYSYSEVMCGDVKIIPDIK